jgi:hypothetical protein
MVQIMMLFRLGESAIWSRSKLMTRSISLVFSWCRSWCFSNWENLQSDPDLHLMPSIHLISFICWLFNLKNWTNKLYWHLVMSLLLTIIVPPIGENNLSAFFLKNLMVLNVSSRLCCYQNIKQIYCFNVVNCIHWLLS